MKLTTLGGSAAGTGIGQGCSSYLVQTDGTTLALDLGPGTLQELRAHTDYRTLDGIVVSHLHADHIADIVALRFTLSYNPVPPPQPIPVWLPPDGKAMLRRVAQAFDTPESGLEWFESVMEIHEYDPAGSVMVGDFTCTFTPTIHFVPCWAIRVHPAGDTGDLLYTADTGPAADLAAFGSGAKVIIAEAAETGSGGLSYEERGHLTGAEAGQLAADVGAETLVLSHMFEEHDPESRLRAAEEAFRGTLLRAMPGLTVRWRF